MRGTQPWSVAHKRKELAIVRVKEAGLVVPARVRPPRRLQHARPLAAARRVGDVQRGLRVARARVRATRRLHHASPVGPRLVECFARQPEWRRRRVEERGERRGARPQLLLERPALQHLRSGAPSVGDVTPRISG